MKRNITLWLKLWSSLDENNKRLVAAMKAIELGHGGVSEISDITKLSRTTIIKGMDELKSKRKIEPMNRQRIAGAGRKIIESEQDELVRDLEKLITNSTAGDPMTALLWTDKSSRTLAEKLNGMGHSVGKDTVTRLLRKLEYSLQSNKKEKEKSGNHKDRNAQFNYINKCAMKFIQQGDPVLSVDSKKKENIGNFKNTGTEYRKKGDPRKVYAYDYPSWAEGKAVPYGVYDRQFNDGLVNVGINKDTAQLAVNSIRLWWKNIGKQRYSGSNEILICADSGGSNSSRARLWKLELQKLATKINKNITVCHYPRGTSKWNAIEHRMFSFISINWRGKPLESYETVINLISNTKTSKGLAIKAFLDENDYKTGIKVSNSDFSNIRIKAHKINPNWNYTIFP